MTPRGVRLNNPGNIRHSTTVWDGEADDQTDQAFVAFSSPEYGLRAIAKILSTYQAADGCKAIRQIITRWAPPSENDTAAYVQDVALEVGVDADAPVDLRNPGLMAKVIAAIVRHENGEQPYSDTQLSQAVRLAGVASTPHNPEASS